jgi:hypothetical protein
MLPTEGKNQTAASRLKVEEDLFPVAADLKADIDVDCRFQDEPDDDDAIRNLNKMGRLKMLKPEFIEKLKEQHREHIANCMNFYDVFVKYKEDCNAAASKL